MAGPSLFDIGGGGIGLLNLIDPSQLTPEQQAAYAARQEATNEANRNMLISQALFGAGGALLNAAGPSRYPISIGQAIGQGIQGAGQGYMQGQTMLANQAKGELDKAKTIQEIQSSKLGNAKTMAEIQDKQLQQESQLFMSGVPLERLPNLSKRMGAQAGAAPGAAMAAPGTGAAPIGLLGAPTGAPAAPSVGLLSPPDTGAPALAAGTPATASTGPAALPYEVLTGQQPPTAEQAMRMASFYDMAGKSADASRMREYAMQGTLGGFRFNGGWNQLAPITGSTQDPNVQLRSSAAGKLMVTDGSGKLAYAPGVVQSEAGKAAATAGASAQATANVELKYAGPKAAATEAARLGVTNSPFNQQQVFENTKQLRQEYDVLPEIKNMKEVQIAYNSAIKSSLDMNNKAADLDLVYAFAKIMDPASVVREGEQLMINKSQPWSETVSNLWNSVSGGSNLSMAQKKELLTVLSNRYGEHAEIYGKTNRLYDNVATARGLDKTGVYSPIELNSSRPYEQHLTDAISSGRLAPDKIPGAKNTTIDGQKRWVVPGLNGYFIDKR